MSRLDVDQVLAQHKSLDPSAMSWPWQEEDENEESEWTKTFDGQGASDPLPPT